MNLLSSDPLLSTLIQWSFLLLIVSSLLIPVECLYKGSQVLFSTCSAAVSPQACQGTPEKGRRDFEPRCVSYTELPTGCATAALSLSLMPWWFVQLQFAWLYFGFQISLRCHGVLSHVHCEDRDVVLTVSLSNWQSQELQQNSNNECNVNHLMLSISECSPAFA